MKLLSRLVWKLSLLSRPARGAWVEIDECRSEAVKKFVAPRKGRVG